MSTIAALLSQMAEANNIRPWDVATRSQNEADTGLLQLQEMRRQQETAARTRQFLQEHPELVLGQGGGSTIGSLLTAPGGPGGAPGQPPGAPTIVPGGQDISRYADVSPQGGGPIPPNVMGQVTPTVTPPQGMPTLATLGQPQGQMQGLQNRFLMDLARTSPDAAMQVQQLMQGQQDRQFKLEEQRLDWTSKKMGYFGQVLQGVNSPESYADAVQEIGRVDPQAAARLPRTYSKEALIPFIKQSTTVKENADLQIKLMHEQTEQGKFQVQLAQAGYQGLGADVTGILKGLSPEQLQEFGGRFTDKAIRYATAEAQKLQVAQRGAEGLAGAQATAQAQQQARLDKTVSEAFGERTTKIYDAQTGQTVDARMKVKDYEALPAGRVKELSANQTEQMENVNSAIPIVAQLQTHIDKIYGPGGVLARMTPDERADLAAVPGRWATQYAQKYPEVAQAQRFINSNASALARALAGEKGAMAEGDVQRAKEMLPNLETTLKVWPPANIGIQSPDTRAVALGTMNSVVDMINGRVRTILGNEQFSHPKLHRYQTADEAQQASGGPGTQPTVAPPQLPIPPTVGLNPNLKPLPPTFGPGDPTQQLRPQAPPPAPPVQPTPPTAGSAPSNDEAYRRLLRPQPPAPPNLTPPTFGPGDPTQQLRPHQAPRPGAAPAPSAPAPRSTPGRQSQARPGASAVRVAGGPKYMDLADVREAMRQTGKSRREVEARARELGYTVYGSKMPMDETMVG